VEKFKSYNTYPGVKEVKREEKTDSRCRHLVEVASFKMINT
jgi:hypothetical protein